MNFFKYIVAATLILSLYSCTSTQIVQTIPETPAVTIVEPKVENFDIPRGLSSRKEIEISTEKYEIKSTVETKIEAPEVLNTVTAKEMELTNKINTLLAQARSYLGTPYRYGGTTRRGIDCSAFVQNSFSVLGIDLPRISAAQSNQGRRIALEEVKKGDLLFFSQSGSRISHVAIVERINEFGEIFFIHAASSKGVSIASLYDTYWSARYKKAVRLVE